MFKLKFQTFENCTDSAEKRLFNKLYSLLKMMIKYKRTWRDGINRFIISFNFKIVLRSCILFDI